MPKVREEELPVKASPSFAREGRVQLLPFADGVDGTLQFEMDVAACLRRFETSEDVEAFLAGLPHYSVGSSVHCG